MGWVVGNTGKGRLLRLLLFTASLGAIFFANVVLQVINGTGSFQLNDNTIDIIFVDFYVDELAIAAGRDGFNDGTFIGLGDL